LRLGLVLAERREAEMARLAESHGLFGVLAGAGDSRTAITAAVYASTATDFVRVAVHVRLGLEHPVTIAEELSVLDNVNNGRTIVLADTGDLTAADAADEVNVIREALGSRPLRHEGPRWKAPAGLPANATAPDAIAVTPKPAQLEVPVWVTGAAAADVADIANLAELADNPAASATGRSVQPGVARISGMLKTDRDLVISWASAGATHLLLGVPVDAEPEPLMTMISRYLAPEVAMPHFPRVMSDSKVPLPWPPDDGA
jgi:alkanesulfonate monooxygenase SsuD/methylene tetrahydromethanopterin reductase-like flavin-dependent oxidoreductase (luciferase family)